MNEFLTHNIKLFIVLHFEQCQDIVIVIDDVGELVGGENFLEFFQNLQPAKLIRIGFELFEVVDGNIILGKEEITA